MTRNEQLPHQLPSGFKSTAVLAVALLLLAASACNAGTSESPTATPTGVASSPEVQQVTGEPVASLSWDPSGMVQFAVEAEGGLDWFSFDPGTGQTANSPGPGPAPSVLQVLGAGTQVQGAIVSPSGGVILYERLPGGEAEPEAGAPFPPFELWVANRDGSGQMPIEARFASRCGILERRATWLRDESLVVGACSPYLGLPAYFVADLNGPEFSVLYFTRSAGGDQVQPGQLTVSGDGSWLAFVDIQREALWQIPVDGIFGAVGGPLDPTNRLPVDGLILSPEWSSDSAYLYYWHSPAFGPDTDACDVSLMRIDIARGETIQVLSKQALVSLLGLSDYASITRCGTEPDWRLSPDGTRFLLRILDTANTDPQLLLVDFAAN